MRCSMPSSIRSFSIRTPCMCHPATAQLHCSNSWKRLITHGPRRERGCAPSMSMAQHVLYSRDHQADALRCRAKDEESLSSGTETEGISSEGDSSIQLSMPRRSRMVTFTCNKCDGTTSRMVNPIAWDKGLVFVQCGQCKVWHKIQDAAGLIDEIRYADEDEASSPDSSATSS